MSDKSDIEKLRILLSHWVEHNHSHEAEMKKWQTVADKNKQPAVAKHLMQAISAMQETDKSLALALNELGGKVDEGHHHHHH
jgi:hypothetical protein